MPLGASAGALGAAAGAGAGASGASAAGASDGAVPVPAAWPRGFDAAGFEAADCGFSGALMPSASRAAFSRRATGGAMLEEALLTNSPMLFELVERDLAVDAEIGRDFVYAWVGHNSPVWGPLPIRRGH